MSASRNARVTGAIGLLALLCVAGCATPSSKPLLSVDAQAEALSRFSMGLLAEAAGDSATALGHLMAAIELDPHAQNIYPPAVAVALKLKQPDDAIRLARQLKKKQPKTIDSILLLARVCALTDRPAEAEALFKQATAEFPENPDTQLSLARFFLSQNQPSKALQALDPPCEDIECLHLLGTLTLASARDITDPLQAKTTILKGINLLERALESDPTNPENLQQLGYAYLFIKQPQKALSAFEQALEEMPADLMLAQQIMNLCIQTESFDHAFELCENLPEQTGTDPEMWLQYLAENMPVEHRNQLVNYLEKQVLEKTPPAFYFSRLSALYLDDERTVDAEATMLKALTIHPDDDRLRIVLGYLHLQQEKYDDAYASFLRVRAESPDSEWAQSPFFAFNFMVAAQKSDHLEEAAATLASTYTNNSVVLNQYMHSLLTGESPVSAQAGIDLLNIFYRLSPEAVETLYYLTLLQAEEEKYEEALENARRFEVLAQDQGSTNLLDGFFYFQYATLYERTGRLEEAEKLFFKAIELGDPPLVASAQNYIAYMWAERGEKLELGLMLIEKALSSESDNAAFIDTLGWIYYMQGRYEEAVDRLKTASELSEEDPAIWEHLGDAYLKLGNPDAAREQWKKALNLTPDEKHLIDRLEENRVNPAETPPEEDNLEDTPPRP